jgi:hypothetical protein
MPFGGATGPANKTPDTPNPAGNVKRILPLLGKPLPPALVMKLTV